jgi:hypothetical protein
MKKKYGIVLFTLILTAAKISAQTVVVTDDNTYVTGQASSVLDVKSTAKGFLAPRMTSAQRTAIASPADGLLVYQTDGLKGFYFYNASAWTMLAAGTGSQWTSTGNNIYYNTGNVGIGINNPTLPLGVKDTLEIRRVGSMSELVFSNTAGSGDLRIAGDGGDLFWQGGGGRNLQMGAYWGIILSGDRQTATFPAFSNGVANTNVLALAQRDASVPLAVQGNSATQTANLMEWRSSAATLDVIDKNGNLGLGVTAPSSKLHVAGTNPLTLNGVQTGVVSDSLLTIASGIVRKLPFSTVTSGSSWSLTGNSGTSSGSHFLGTTDNTSLKFRTNSIQGMVLDSLGNAGIGTAPAFTAGTNQEKLLVDAGTTGSFNAIVARGAINNYFQLNIQNQSNGVSASADIVATSDNGSESVNYVDMGINSSTNTQNIMGAANDAYLYTTGNNLLVGTGTAAKSLVFMTGGTTQSTNERMRIDGSGNMGIGVTAPAQKLDVNGNLKLSGAFMPAGTAGNAGEFLTSSGAGLAPTWLNASPYIGAVAWLKAGNAGTSSNTDFIGTTDNASLLFKANNVQGFILDSMGCAAFGSSPAFTSGTNREELLVDAGTTSSFNAIVARGSVNNYFQLNIQNKSNGTTASADIVATADNGTESVNFVDMGINSSTNTQNIMGAANDAYLYTTGNNLLIGTATAAQSLVFMTGGTAQTTNERMRIDGTGKVGIGTNAPTTDLTLYQGTGGAASSRGFRLTGNSIGGTNSGTGFGLALGYNVANNKQLWLGDADYLGNATGSFIRYTVASGAATLDAIAGDNSVRRPLALGVGGDPLAAVIFGADGSTTAPGSFVWDNGNMAIGNSYRANAAPANGLIVQGNTGIGLTSPTAALHLRAGTVTASTGAPLKFTSGTSLTTPEAGAVEFDGTNYFATSATTRYTLAKTLTATAALDFPSTATNLSANLTIAVAGAADGDVVVLGVPSAAVSANSCYTAYVSGANTVTVVFNNYGAATLNPASATFRVSIIKY